MINLTLDFNDVDKKYNSITKNLSIISNIQQNDKLYIQDSTLAIQPYSSTRYLVRWWNKYNRQECMKFITELYNQLSSLNNQLVSLATTYNKAVKKRKHRRIKKKYLIKKAKLLNLCKDTKKGLLHLMITYKNDKKVTDFVNYILSIIDKMD